MPDDPEARQIAETFANMEVVDGEGTGRPQDRNPPPAPRPAPRVTFAIPAAYGTTSLRNDFNIVSESLSRPTFGAPWRPFEPTFGSSFATTTPIAAADNARLPFVSSSPPANVSSSDRIAPSHSLFAPSSPANGSQPLSETLFNAQPTQNAPRQPNTGRRVGNVNAGARSSSGSTSVADRNLTKRKKYKLRRAITIDMASAIVCIRRNNIAGAARVLDQIHLDLIDELKTPIEKRSL